MDSFIPKRYHKNGIGCNSKQDIQCAPYATQRNAKEIGMDNERYLRGWANLKKVDGQAGENVIESLRDIAPDFARLLIEFPFGDIYSRPGLDLKTRELAVVAALTAMGNRSEERRVGKECRS